ncbi:MAG: hypothetical protein CMJ18_20975 [Phycisphaeraceae bacterium]|nr:hypothetical protein [Phycisphaeraceae bacterium]
MSQVSSRSIGVDTTGDRHYACRRMIVGPWVNQPEEYEGYNGFVGWAGIARTRAGRWLLTFTSGLWHATLPWTEEIRRDPECRARFEAWHALGLPDMYAPRGGRAHIMHSDDEGLTWSKPTTLVDTDSDDRHPGILELADGSLMCTFFSSRFPHCSVARYMLSRDGGESWSEPIGLPGSPPHAGFGNGPAITLRDGTVVWATRGAFDPDQPHDCIGVMRSRDHARTFELAATIKADRHLSEPTIVEVADQVLTMAIRREGDFCYSQDGGLSWEHTASTGWGIYDPHLVMAPNGVLALFHGSYLKEGGIHVLLSPDGGRTWHGPGSDAGVVYGYSVDPGVYGYCHPMLLPDGTVYLVYLHTGGHAPADARSEAIWGLRVSVHDDAGGIDILPAAGSPADRGREITDASLMYGGDPELGNLP